MFSRALSAEAALRADEISEQVNTLYIGGGTPSVLPLSVFEDLLLTLGESGHAGPFDEFTVEVNPEDIVEKGGTYVEGLLKVVSPDGRVRSCFNQTETRTGRISSTEPNMQNIPVRGQLGREMRRYFTASDEDHILLDADYSQIELRLMAHFSGDEAMVDAFRTGQDVHARTASEIFDVPLDQVTPTLRSNAKAVNFGIVYGISEWSLSEDIGVSVKEAKEYMQRYFDTYSGVYQYQKDIVAKAKEDGYINGNCWLLTLSSDAKDIFKKA